AVDRRFRAGRDAEDHQAAQRTPPLEKKKAGKAGLFPYSGVPSYFLSIFLSAFFLPSDFFLPSPFFFSAFFSILSPSAPACDAAKAEALTAANIAATITVISLLISISCLVFETGSTRRGPLPRPLQRATSRAVDRVARSSLEANTAQILPTVHNTSC